ncbi:MAG: hypothetical protein JWN94_2143 [Betaproteobacteria bacterium]|nr:hypothetical protein [Betaproteobacteria bacterium]
MLKFGLRPSRLLATILVLAHAAAVVLIWTVAFPSWAASGATAVLVVQCFYLVRQRALLLGANSATAIEITSDHQLNIQSRAADWSECDVLDTTYVTPYLTLLNYRPRGNRLARHIALLPDSLHPDDFRKLRVWLQWRESGVAP